MIFIQPDETSNFEQLSVDGNTVVSVTYQDFSISDLSTRRVNTTNQFSVPANTLNRAIFKHLPKSDSTNYFKAKLVESTELLEGIAIVTQAGDRYNLQILDGTSLFFSLLDGKTLGSLDTSDIDPDSSSADASFWSTYLDSIRATTTGACAPLMSYGKYTSTIPGNINSEFYLPGVYYHYVLQKIITEAGYTFEGDIFADPRYLRLFIPYSQPSFSYSDSFRKAREFTALKTANQVRQFIAIGQKELITFPIERFNGELQLWNGLDTYTVPELSYRFGINVYMEMVYDISFVGAGTVAFTLKHGATTIGTSGVSSPATNARLIFDSRGAFALGVTSGDVLRELTLEMEATAGAGIDATVTVKTATLKVEVNESFLNIGSVSYAGILPNFTRKDFVKDFLIMFGQVPIETANKLTFKSIKEILLNHNASLDWTSKRVNNLTTNYRNGYAQRNYFRYKETEGVNEFDGEGLIEFDNNNLPLEKTLFTSVFSNTFDQKVGNKIFAEIPVYTDSVDRREFDNDPGNRLLIIRDYDFDGEVTYDVTGRTDFKVAYFILSRSLLSCSLQEFIDDYYTFPEDNEVTADYRLNVVDMQQINAHKIIYDTDSFYKVLEISNFIAGESTRVKLLKI